MSSIQPQLKFSDQGDEKLYFRRYSALPPRDKAVVRIIDHNNKDYFTAINEDADLIADAVYKTASVIKKLPQKYRYVTISPQVLASTVVRYLLVDRAFKVEFYSSRNFDLLHTATPANYEAVAAEYGVNVDTLQPAFAAPIIAAVKAGPRNAVGCCFIDLGGARMLLTEFVDNDLYSNLESLIIQVGIKEAVVPQTAEDDPETAKLLQVFAKNDVVVSTVRGALFSARDVEQDLAKLVDSEDKIELVLGAKGISGAEHQLSLACCAALVGYLGLLNDSDVKHFQIDKYDLNLFVKLDLSTVKALNIFPAHSPAGGGSGSVTSIFELLNRCKTSAGLRLLSLWLKQPLTDLALICERQHLVQLLIDDTSLRVFVAKNFLAQVPDLKRLIKKISGGLKRPSQNENKKLDDVVRIYQLVVALPDLINLLKITVEEQDEETARLIGQYWLGPIETCFESLSKLRELVETTIDLTPLENAGSLLTDFNLKPEFDPQLVEISTRLNATLAEIKEHHAEVGDDLCVDIDKKLKLENHQQHGWCFRVTRTDSSILRGAAAGKYVELQTVKAGIFFTTKHLRLLSNKYQELTQEYNSKQKENIKVILGIVLTYSLVLNQVAMVLAHLDVLNSFAHVSIYATTPYVRPQLTALADPSRKLHLSNARHPVLEVQDDINFIGNDVRMGPGGDEGNPFVIITGPNMGGKSTYIRQIGVIALMAQVGCFIPVEPGSRPQLPIFDAILSRIGAGDSQLKGLSTFMIEMLETSSILSSASSNSLIIIDELGRGTSTYDGFGLAWAILEHLIKEKNCFTLFATHFHELTALSAKYADKVTNLHVVAHIEANADEDDITLMYKVEPGISDKSFGIHVAELVKFPAKIVNMAKRKVSELQATDDDTAILAKRTKCTPEEFTKGVTLLKDVLQQWKARCVEDGRFVKSSAEAIAELKAILGDDYKEAVAADKFIQEILTAL